MLSILGIFVIFGCLLVYLQQWILLKVELKSSLIESTKFVIHVFKLPYDYFFNHSNAETIKRIALNNSVATLLTRQLTTTVLNFITIIFYGIVMLKQQAQQFKQSYYLCFRMDFGTLESRVLVFRT